MFAFLTWRKRAHASEERAASACVIQLIGFTFFYISEIQGGATSLSFHGNADNGEKSLAVWRVEASTSSPSPSC